MIIIFFNSSYYCCSFQVFHPLFVSIHFHHYKMHFFMQELHFLFINHYHTKVMMKKCQFELWREWSSERETDGWPLSMPLRVCQLEMRGERSGGELVWAVSTTRCWASADSAVLASPAPRALHLARLPHSYRKISTDLPFNSSLALMERGPLIRDGRAMVRVFRS